MCFKLKFQLAFHSHAPASKIVFWVICKIFCNSVGKLIVSVGSDVQSVEYPQFFMEWEEGRAALGVIPNLLQTIPPRNHWNGDEKKKGAGFLRPVLARLLVQTSNMQESLRNYEITRQVTPLQLERLVIPEKGLLRLVLLDNALRLSFLQKLESEIFQIRGCTDQQMWEPFCLI